MEKDTEQLKKSSAIVSAAPPTSTEIYTAPVTPQLRKSTPTVAARVIAFVMILIGGLMGSAVGFAVAQIFTTSKLWLSIGLISGAVGAAIGISIILMLALQSMVDWKIHKTKK